MNYTAKERKEYNQHRENACTRLGITKAQYNWFRRAGEKLHGLYEENCNGTIEEVEYNIKTNSIEKVVDDKAASLGGLHVYYQTDPRGATIYLDKVEIPRNNYTQAVCIY